MGAEATDDDMSWDDDDDVVVVVDDVDVGDAVDDDVDDVVGSLSSEGDSSQSCFECEFPASDDESLAPGVFVVCADGTCEEFEAPMAQTLLTPTPRSGKTKTVLFSVKYMLSFMNSLSAATDGSSKQRAKGMESISRQRPETPLLPGLAVASW